ncbi:hypothetical protein [Streptomyces sp. NPDC001744]|uniref:hypothetical protein n=1 Tax=Streptomyces sp. NPDC001744 TaxID=3364606 RepID=UPI0036D02F0D
MGRSTRRLAALLPVLLCALWSLFLAPVSAAAAPAPVSAGAVPAPTTARAVPVAGPPDRTAPAPGPAHRLAPPEPHLSPVAVAGFPAAVEHSVRFPAPPAAPTAAPVGSSPPVRGLLAGDPRRERAPPGGPHVPRDPRGPPSTRHS